MTLHRPPLITNRFEIVLLILMSFIISTRLIWLQIEDRNPIITDEFYSTSLVFSRSMGGSCPHGMDPDFPFSSIGTDYNPGGTGATSPGLELAFWAVCRAERLSVAAVLDYAPTLIGLSAFLVAVISRLLTSNWVGGLIAASVVLSRGSILKGTHIAGTAIILQPLVCLVFMLMCLYARTRDGRWLPALFATCVLAIVLSPLFALTAWLLCVLLLARLLVLRLKTHLSAHRMRVDLMAVVVTLMVLPALTLSLRMFMPSATIPVAIVTKTLFTSSHGLSLMDHFMESARLGLSEINDQDLHWQSSVAFLALAATWKRFLPRGSGFWALTIMVLSLSGLWIDGSLNKALETQTPAMNWPLSYKLTGAIASLEPIVIGTASAYAWFAVRSMLVTLFPGYSRSAPQHDKLK